MTRPYGRNEVSRMERITTPAGVTISYEKSGTGPPLVLVHGSLTNHMTAWMLVTPLLEPDFSLYAVDRRGRGETTATEGHTIPEEAADLVALFESIAEPVFLLGHSFGAQISLAAANLAPDRVRRLVLYEPPVPDAVSPNDFSHLMRLAGEDDYAAMVDYFMRNTIKVPSAEVDAIQNSPVWPLLVADGLTSSREWPALLDYGFDAANFGGLDVPVLLITGSESPPHLYATDALAASLPNVRIEVIPGQGHGANVMAPQEFVNIVTSFLKEE